MRTTITLSDNLLAMAARLTGIADRTPLIREDLKGDFFRESVRWLALLDGSTSDFEVTPRRRPDLESFFESNPVA